ncbi:MAG: hypothetical protein JNN15_13785 [Blastocatellia bacterium]|nr:hypothetical protein [Blastocatellia bacterium]
MARIGSSASLPRRRKYNDPLAKPSVVEKLLKELAYQLRSSLHTEDIQLLPQLLKAASTQTRYAAKAKTVHSSRFSSELLKEAAEKTKAILDRETYGRISLRTFVDNNMRILSCPSDIKQMLEEGKVTLFEALQLKRLSSEKLSISESEAQALRSEFINNCRKQQWLSHHLRHQIDTFLVVDTQKVVNVETQALSEPKTNPLVLEQLNLIVDMIKEIDFDHINRLHQEDILLAIDELILKLQKAKRHQEKRKTSLLDV